MCRTALLTLASLVCAAVASAADQKPASPDAKPAPAAKAVKASPSTPASGVVVFIDPATGQMVQPTAAEIGTLVNPTGSSPAPKAPATTIKGPGGAVGVVLPPESVSYSVATTTAGGKVALDCVTGEKAANRIAAGEAGGKAARSSKGPGDAKK